MEGFKGGEMRPEEVLFKEEGERLFLLGNEAAVRGALEGGVAVVATYPGTPSSEIGDLFSAIAKEAGVYFEFSANEKVALEVAAASSVSGLRSFVFMKHVGLNVASDSFMSTAYTGTRGGLIVLSADDPSMFSSQNEQDNRIYARIGGVPLLEPSNPQEVKDLVKYGLDVSEEYGLPILIRTTTRVSHMRGIVKLGKVNNSKKNGFFKKDPSRFVPVPDFAKKMHSTLMEKLDTISKLSEMSDLNKIYGSGDIGVITSGSSFNYVMDVIKEDCLDLKVLKLTFSYPFPEKLVRDFLLSVKRVFIVEEVEPVIEEAVFGVAGRYKIPVDMHGKTDGTFPRIYEYNPDIISGGFKKVLGGEISKKYVSFDFSLPPRPPVLCPGCPHRATYYALKRAISKLELPDVIFPSDIGCYTLGIQPPYREADYLLSMGSSIGTGHGFSKATGQKIVSFIGDSTFFHAGLPALANAVHNKGNLLLTILDNRTTAMTGNQPGLSVPLDGMGDSAPEISIENVVKSIGVDFCRTVDPYQIKNTEEVFEQALKIDGVRVVIAKHPCALISDRERRKRGVWFTFRVNHDKCKMRMECVNSWACPAFYIDENGLVQIDQKLCDGCGVCVQCCPEKAIEVVK